MMQSELVFGYGSNMDPAQMRERCPESDLTWFIAEARGYKLCFPRKSIKRKGGVGSITPVQDASVWGVVFAVSKRDLARLDDYEGVPKQAYTRDKIEVFTSDGDRLKVWTYIATPKGIYHPHSEYLTLYVRGAQYFGLPQVYTAVLEKELALARLREKGEGSPDTSKSKP